MYKTKKSFKYIKTLIKWVFFACLVGIFGGIVGSLFHHSIDYVTRLRINNPKIIYFLPFGGAIIALMYSLFKEHGNMDTNRVISAVSQKKDIPFVMMPLIFICSVITHLVGGSSGREGAALQLGGSLGCKIGKIFKLENNEMSIIIMSGMSAVFSALFGTPIAAAIFALEVACLKRFSVSALFPCIISSFEGYIISLQFAISPVRFDLLPFDGYSFNLIIKTVIISAICSLVSILFCVAIQKTEYIAKKAIKDSRIRGLCGGIIILLLTLLIGSYDYNGAGMNVIEEAISGKANYEAFIFKIVFTAITVAAGFKGGEIVPAFFIGSTLGCFLGEVIGIEPGIGAAIGFISLFCGITKCPIASFFLAIEVFNFNWLVLFILVSVISFVFSGKTGIYENHRNFTITKKDI